MDNYTRIIAGGTANIVTPTAPQLAAGLVQLAPLPSNVNNGFYNEMSTAINRASTELTNIITAAGITPSNSVLTQVGTAVASIAAQGGIFGVDSGVVNAYVITQVSPFPAPFQLENGMTVIFRAGNANTGACTAAPFGFVAKSIKLADGATDPTPGMISTTQDTQLTYDGTVWRMSGISGVAQATTAQAGLVELATNAETAAGTDTLRAIVPSALAALFGASTLANPFNLILPVKIGGAFVNFIVKGGRAVGIASSGTISFAVAFPTSGLFHMVNAEDSIGIARIAQTTSAPSTTGIDYNTLNSGGTSAAATAVNWLAIGY
tara:strand:+ start:894 stop:1856 length:963 start_codon:yes stop_codon:yes gene_type:complete